jgi:hypothetical protein
MGRKTPEILSERLSVADGRIIYQLVDGEVQIYDDYQRVQTCFHFNRRGSFIPHLEQNHDNLQLVQFREALGDIVLFAPNPRELKSVTSSEAQELDTNGSNFASWFRGILVADSESGVELNRLLRLALPGAQRLHYELISSSVREVRIAFQSRHQTVDIPIDELSTGQRAAILMFGFLAGTRIKQPRVVFIDRPETDLDPHTTEFMLSYIKDSYNNCQFILGSNQQTILDSASEVLWLSRPDGGHTQVSKTQQ